MNGKKKLAAVFGGMLLLLVSLGLVACNGKDEREARQWKVQSPDGSVTVTLSLDKKGRLSYQVADGETAVVEPSAMGFEMEEDDLAGALRYESESTGQISGSYTNISGRNSEVAYECRELAVTFAGQAHYLDVTVRAYDDGYAFRYGIRAMDGSEGNVTVLSEDTEFALPEASVTWSQAYKSNAPEKGDFFSYEEAYTRRKSDNLSGRISAMPILYKAGDSDTYSLITESGLIGSGYYGSFLREEDENQGTGILHTIHNVAGAAEPDNKVWLPFTSPWRVGAVGTLTEVCESEIVEKVYDDAAYWRPDDYDSLSQEEQETYTYDWVKAGVTGWNWLAYTGERSQSDWELQREYVDLAQEMGWSYVILDGGWDQTELNVKSFTRYANERGVKVIAWCNAFNLFENGDTDLLEKRLSLWKSWGIDGIKIDFFDGQESTGLTHQGEDIETIKWYESIYQVCARLRMVVNCHGCNKPTGERRIYPNVINREAIYGNELWPVSDVTVNTLFTRQVLGAADFTPMVVTKKGGLTVGHEMALAVLYESGAPSMADYAETYREELINDFYSAIPALRDETIFLCGEPDGYYCGAVRVGQDWFVAGVNGSGIERTVQVDLSFLDDGPYTAEVFEDSADDSVLIDREKQTLEAGSSLAVTMKESGGFVIWIRK